MSFERGFPIPKHGNWSPITRGMPVPRESGTDFCQESMTTTTTGRNGDTTELTISQRNGITQRATSWKPETPGSSTPQKNGIGQKRNPWTPVTPEKLVKGKKEKQSKTSDKWQDFVGVYKGLLKKDTVDTKKRSFTRSDESKGAALVSYFKNDPANWKCNHLASIVCSKSSSKTQNHLSNSTPLLHVRRKSRKRSTSSTSTLGSQQTHKFTSISTGQTSKDGATSSTITESIPIAPITPAKHKVNQREQENVKISTNEDSPPSAVSTTHKDSLPSVVSTKQKESTPSTVSSTMNDSPPSAVSITQIYSPPSAVSTPQKDPPPSVVSSIQDDSPPSALSITQKDSPPSAVSITQKDSAVSSTQKDATTQNDSPPSALSITQKDSPPPAVSITQKDSAVSSTQKDSPPSAVSASQKDSTPSAVSTTQKDSPPSAISRPPKDSPPSAVSATMNDSTPSAVSITQKDSPPSAVSSTQKDSPPFLVSSTQKDSPPSAVSTPQKDSSPFVVSTPQKDSPPSTVSSTQKEPIVPDEKDEHGIDMSKTPQQKTPTRRRKHRPRVIKPQKPKKVKKDGTTPGEPRVKRKYVRKGVNVSETQPKTPVASTRKRKYVRKKNIDQVKGQQESTADDTPVKSCKKKLNFDLDINLNANPQDNIEQEKKINGNKNMPLPVVNVPIPKTTHHALNMLARNMSMSPRENKYNNIVPPNLQNVQQPNLPSISVDERRGTKRQNIAMDSLYLYQKLLLGVAHRSHNHNVFLENHKKRKIQSGSFTENSIQMNGTYNGSPMQLLHSGGQKVNPANFVNCQYQPHPHVIRSTPEGLQFYTQGHGIGWNQPQPIPPNEGIKHGVITYPATLLEKKKRVEEKKMRVEKKKMVEEKKRRVEEKKKRVEKGEVSVDDITYKLERMCISDKKKGENEVVLYKGSDAIVPFEPIKKRNQRPKVDLDPETDRLWKLILGKEESEGGETLDKDKEKWWENERKVFRGRADSFIARMHLVQGDRRFSKWKGSVVDSVIGVFLTQNVSDHLSSSAFMALAAKYPRKDSCQDGECERPIEVTEKKDAMKCDENIKEPGTKDSLESTTTQIAEETGSSSGSNSEAEDLTTGQDAQKQESVILEGTPINVEANSKEQNISQEPSGEGAGASSSKEKKRIAEDERNIATNWDSLRKEALSNSEKKEESRDARDSLDYEAFRHAHVNEISDAIKERGMNNLLAERMQNFLNRLVRDHGKIDLEWLRDAPPDKAKDYLLSFRGLGLKSVECIRLLTLHHLAFPVDTNVGRIAVRLGWVPLQPLPESLQLHLLEMYPVLDSIQKYLWPRLSKLDQLTLYELHYQMITFGKVFCTKSKPNCNACPMRAECRHFASAFASARLALPCPEEKKIVTSNAPIQTDTTPPPMVITTIPLPLPEGENKGEGGCFGNNCEPIIEEPTTPEPEATPELSLSDIEDQYYEDSDEIPSIKLNMEEFTNNLQSIIQDNNKELQDDMSKSLVALTPNAARIPTPKLKDISRLRTAHQVYELPDSHQLLEGLEKRELDDPSPYLLAIWTPGETANSIQPPERECPAQESGGLCDKTTCFSCNSIKEANSQVVRGTILIPCRTATRGSFPLNGTYFQVNEMFADHESSLNPIDVPRAWLWNLPRRTVYFGTSVTTIFRGLSTQGIQYCFWKGFVCVRGFDRKSRAPRPLMARLHFPASKLIKIRNEGK